MSKYYNPSWGDETPDGTYEVDVSMWLKEAKRQEARAEKAEAEVERHYKMAQALDHMTDHFMYSETMTEDEFKEFVKGCEKPQKGGE